MNWITIISIFVGVFVVLPELTGMVVNLARIRAEREIQVQKALAEAKDASEVEKVGFDAR